MQVNGQLSFHRAKPPNSPASSTQQYTAIPNNNHSPNNNIDNNNTMLTNGNSPAASFKVLGSYESTKNIELITKEAHDLLNKTRKLKLELDEKNEIITMLSNELEESKDCSDKLKRENLQLIQDSRRAKMLQDENDILVDKVNNCDRLEAEIAKLKQKVVEVDFLTKQIEELDQSKCDSEQQVAKLEDRLAMSEQKFKTINELEANLTKWKDSYQKLETDNDSIQKRLLDSIDQENKLTLTNKQLEEEVKHLKSLLKTYEDKDEEPASLIESSVAEIEQLDSATHLFNTSHSPINFQQNKQLSDASTMTDTIVCQVTDSMVQTDQMDDVVVVSEIEATNEIQAEKPETCEQETQTHRDIDEKDKIPIDQLLEENLRTKCELSNKRKIISDLRQDLACERNLSQKLTKQMSNFTRQMKAVTSHEESQRDVDKSLERDIIVTRRFTEDRKKKQASPPPSPSPITTPCQSPINQPNEDSIEMVNSAPVEKKKSPTPTPTPPIIKSSTSISTSTTATTSNHYINHNNNNNNKNTENVHIIPTTKPEQPTAQPRGSSTSPPDVEVDCDDDFDATYNIKPRFVRNAMPSRSINVGQLSHYNPHYNQALANYHNHHQYHLYMQQLHQHHQAHHQHLQQLQQQYMKMHNASQRQQRHLPQVNEHESLYHNQQQQQYQHQHQPISQQSPQQSPKQHQQMHKQQMKAQQQIPQQQNNHLYNNHQFPQVQPQPLQRNHFNTQSMRQARNFSPIKNMSSVAENHSHIIKALDDDILNGLPVQQKQHLQHQQQQHQRHQQHNQVNMANFVAQANRKCQQQSNENGNSDYNIRNASSSAVRYEFGCL